ncbi:MAG: energy transducer TonB [bacterium]|nr:energy transducer TonB [bacterium]
MKYILLFLLLTPALSWAQEEPPKMPVPPPPEPNVAPQEVIDFPDVEAEFPGGRDAMDAFIKENMNYPEIAKNSGTQGRVYLEFVVGNDGAISQVRVMLGVSPELDREAKRIIRSMPKWKPGEANGKPVHTRYRLPIAFRLSEAE